MTLEEDLQNEMCRKMFAAVIINLHSKAAIMGYHFGDVYNYTTYCKIAFVE